MLEKSKVESLYEQLLEYLQEMSPGERIMPVRQIMQEYGISQLTVVQALSRLETDGRISKDPGRGYFVRDNRPSSVLRLGFVVPDWPSQSMNELEEMLKLQGRNSGYAVSRHNYQMGEMIHNHLPVRDFDVIAMIPDINAMTPEFIYKIGLSPVPVILCWVSTQDIQLNCVTGDPFVTGGQAASYLIRQGHRKLCVMISEPISSSVIRARVAGFRMVAESNDCELTIINAEVKSGEYSQDKTHKTLSAWLKNHDPAFSAMYVVSDETALAAIRALNDHGLSVPEQMSVMGSDGLRQGAFFHPPLTVVAVEAERVAASIIAMAGKLAADRSRTLQEYIMPTIIERKSVRPFA